MARVLFSDICWIIRTLKSHGFPAFIAGGAVRDLLMGRAPEDYDIATTAPPEKIVSIFPRTKPAGKVYGTTLIIVEHRPYQVTTLQSSGGTYTDLIEEDIQRRDFTINAMIWDPIEDHLIDTVGGMKDLKNRILKPTTTAEEIFLNDPIRMLRAIRISHSLQFTLHPSIFPAIRALRKQIKRVSPERIQYELVKILTLTHVTKALCPLVKTRLLFEFLPELALLSHLKQSPYHDYSALSHTFRTLYFTEKIINNPSFFNLPTKTSKHILMLAALLHDIGKPDAHQVIDGIHHFYGHEKIGAEKTGEILKRLRFPKRDIQLVKSIVTRHLYPLHLYWLYEKNTLTPRAIERFRRKTGNFSLPLLVLSTADQLAKHRSGNEELITSWRPFCEMLLGS